MNPSNIHSILERIHLAYKSIFFSKNYCLIHPGLFLLKHGLMGFTGIYGPVGQLQAYRAIGLLVTRHDTRTITVSIA